MMTLVVPSMQFGTRVNSMLKTKLKDKFLAQRYLAVKTMCCVLPAGWLVQTQIVLNPALHLLSVKLHHLRGTLARTAVATTSARRDLSPCFEPFKVGQLEVARNVALPR